MGLFRGGGPPCAHVRNCHRSLNTAPKKSSFVYLAITVFLSSASEYLEGQKLPCVEIPVSEGYSQGELIAEVHSQALLTTAGLAFCRSKSG